MFWEKPRKANFPGYTLSISSEQISRVYLLFHVSRLLSCPAYSTRWLWRRPHSASLIPVLQSFSPSSPSCLIIFSRNSREGATGEDEEYMCARIGRSGERTCWLWCRSNLLLILFRAVSSFNASLQAFIVSGVIVRSIFFIATQRFFLGS